MIRIAFFPTVVIVALSTVTPAAAQTLHDAGGTLSASSSIERRASAVERRENTRLFRAQPPQKAELIFRLSPSVIGSDGGTRSGIAANLVYAPPTGAGSFTLRPSYRTFRSRDPEQSHLNGFGIGADVQLNADDDRFGQFIVSGDYVRSLDTYQLAAGTLEYDLALRDDLTFVAAASLSRFAPETGPSVSDVIPSLEVDFKAPTKAAKVTLIAAYTFTNDVDGEDDYEGGVRFGIGESSAARVAFGKNGRVGVSFVQVLK